MCPTAGELDAEADASGTAEPLAAGEAGEAGGAAEGEGTLVGVAGAGVPGGSDGGSVSTGPGVMSVSHAYLGPVAA